MYVGSLSDFFYKPKDFLLNLPKYKQRQEVTFLNINNRIFRINNVTGNINLISNSKEHNLTINNKFFNNKNSINTLRYNKSRNNDNVYFTMNNTSKTKNTGLTDYVNKTLNNEMNKTHKLKFSDKTYKNKIRKIPLLSLINAYKTSYNIRASKIKSIKSVEETFKKNIFPYYNKSPKKFIKPKIVFGQKLHYETIPNKNSRSKNLLQENNSFLTIYKQHYNNITNDGNNDKIYFETKNDDMIMKAFKEQILKERVEKELKNKFKFFIKYKNNIVKIPKLSHKNFDFYKGYSVSDSKRGNSNYHKLFFRNINRNKFEEKLEKPEKLEKQTQI